MPYKYIVIEGNIGAGKTTLVKKLGEDLKAKLVLERFTENIFLPKFYKNPGRFSLPVELSFLVERYHQLKEELSTNNMSSSIIIADYYFAKSLIFARITLKDEEYILYRQVYDIIHQNLPLPDLYVYIHLPVESLISNIKKRGRNYESKIEESYLLNLQNGYLEYLKTQTDMSILFIDGNNINYINNQDVYMKLKNSILNTQYPLGINRLIM